MRSLLNFSMTGALLCGAAADAAAANAASASASQSQSQSQPRPAVVELFTSEGCSSCPPAEAYVGELSRRGDVLALTFHVDYWDDLGWRDRFGLPGAVQRQRGYAQSLRLSSVYTPQVVIDGQADYVGSDRSAIGKALAAERRGAAIALSARDGEVVVNLRAPDSPAPAPQTAGTVGAAPQRAAPSCDVLLISYLRTAMSPIGRGENAGRTIAEFNIVRSLQSLGRWDGQTQQYRSRLDSLPADATDVAVLVQSAGQAQIVGAATLALR
jgi:hypothetical protein